MSKTSKTGGQTPTAGDYNNLLEIIDDLTRMFKHVSKNTPEMKWWSITVSEDITDSGDVSLCRWAELLQTDYKAELCNLGGICNKDRNQWILYAVAGKGVTLELYKKVADVCASVIKALEINLIPKFRVTLYERLEFSREKCFTRFNPARYKKFTDWRESVFNLLWVTEQPRAKLSVSEYLDALAENGNKLLPASGGATIESYWITSWFEFIFNTAQESGCSIRTFGGSQYSTGCEEAEIPFRRIDHDICEASILALEFLRIKVNARIESLSKDTVKIEQNHKLQEKAGQGENWHNDDFTEVRWSGKRYKFDKPQQALSVEYLWNNKRAREKSIGEAISSEADNFRLIHVFRQSGKKAKMHPAWGIMIVADGKGIYALAESKKAPKK